MKYSGVFLISNPSAQLDASRKLVSALVHSIEAHAHSANRQPEAWTLTDLILRDVPPQQSTQSNNNAPPWTHSYMHNLHLSYLSPDSAYIFVQRPALHPPMKQEGAGQQAATPAYTASEMVQIPREQTAELYNNHILPAWSQLWTPQRTLEVPYGIVYKIRDTTIHIGELHSKRQGPQSANVLYPGVVVCITRTCGTSDDDLGLKQSSDERLAPDDIADVQKDIHQLWKDVSAGVDFGKGETREFMQIVQDFEGSKEKEREAVVQMWAEALRMRG
ncbi:hypothetical protein K458DRAFT_441892 [Lentithecium fluviatile CBS 122367]|uniref:Uncharacterized protein n=1 Tax=Lentithecium fluviatile CBS 122367 TaxID=1168545 RepID=A0A6G1J752_9PLEO|nr:hypothetical protein K458DRAFT_441892 [Lentithecium fluviatile CBS 122367]